MIGNISYHNLNYIKMNKEEFLAEVSKLADEICLQSEGLLTNGYLGNYPCDYYGQPLKEIIFKRIYAEIKIGINEIKSEVCSSVYHYNKEISKMGKTNMEESPDPNDFWQ